MEIDASKTSPMSIFQSHMRLSRGGLVAEDADIEVALASGETDMTTSYA